MKNSTPKTGHYRLWQYIIMLVIIVSLLVSALPNYFQQNEVISITSQDSLNQSPSNNRLINLLAEQGIKVDNIVSSSGITTISLTEQQKFNAAYSLVNEQLSDEYLIEKSQLNTAPTWLQKLGGQPIKLGLDLSGGVLFVLDVDLVAAQQERIKQVIIELKSIAMSTKFRGSQIKLQPDNSVLIHYAKSSAAKINTYLNQVTKSFPNLSVKKDVSGKVIAQYNEKQWRDFEQETMLHTIKTMRGRIEELGITEAVTQRQGKNRIRIELPGVHDPEQAKRVIGATASLDFYQMANTGSGAIKRIKDQTGRLLSLNAKPVFSGSSIKNANAGRDQLGQPLVNLLLDNIGGKKMSNFSKGNIGQPMVTVYSEYYRNSKNEVEKKSEVLSVATIQAHLSSQFSLTNLASPQVAQDLSLILRAGSLTAPVTIVKQRTIEATLGAENIDNGIKALTIGITFTLLFMAFFYRQLGLIANIALALNLVCLLGLMSLLPGAVLTLPGIAGLVLTVGMAVDTNVIIFERIKEELSRGRKVFSAIHTGYNNAFSTILDANITTLLTAIILYVIGYGPVKGFALTLCLGILTSMFTGVFVSKALTQLTIRKNCTKLMGVSL